MAKVDAMRVANIPFDPVQFSANEMRDFIRSLVSQLVLLSLI